MYSLHAGYREAGKISNDDMVYTLSLFALEPSSLVGKHERRGLTALELCACGTYCKNIGESMKISYEEFPSCAVGWQDGLHCPNEMKARSVRYEQTYVVVSSTNKQLADSHVEILSLNVPTRMLGHLKKMKYQP